MGQTGLSLKKGRLAKRWQAEHRNSYLSSVLKYFPEHRLWDVPKTEFNYLCWMDFFELEQKLNIDKKEHSYLLKEK